jgi:site-specific DNA-methyltransferase (adenine-specific)
MSEGFYKGEAFRSSVDDTWTTPRKFFNELNSEFGFTLDAAALKGSTLVPDNWFGPDHDDPSRRDALVMDWAEASRGGPVWLNPPYGRGINAWVAKAHAESKKGLEVVCLVPARTDTNWWWDSCVHHEIRFIKGRLKFGDGKNSAPFPSALVVMNDCL